MEHRTGQPEHIGAILARSQQGLSKAWSEKVTKICSCGETFEDSVYHKPDGKIIESQACFTCRQKERDEQQRKDLELRLNKAQTEMAELWLKSSNIPEKYHYSTFDNFDQKLQPRAYQIVKAFDWQSGSGDSLVLLSPGIYGIGKTHLVCALLNETIKTDSRKAYIENGSIHRYRCPFYYTTENELLRRIRETFNHKDDAETEEDIYKLFSPLLLLIIDDVGKVRPKDQTFTQGVYFNIIDQRYSNSQATILTTNLDYADLEVHIGGACADRLREMCGKDGFVKMTGKSYRQKVADK